MQQSDEELMSEYQAGNGEALKMLFTRYRTPLFNFGLRILQNRADAEDVVGEVFLMILSNAKCYKPQAKFSTWLYTVVRNRSISRIRLRRGFWMDWLGTGSQEDIILRAEDPGPSGDKVLQDKEMKGHIQTAIAKLPLAQKEAIVLREYEGLSYDEIREILGCSLEKVKILIFRARENLRKQLGPALKGE